VDTKYKFLCSYNEARPNRIPNKHTAEQSIIRKNTTPHIELTGTDSYRLNDHTTSKMFTA